jgi:hypothetical protein
MEVILKIQNNNEEFKIFPAKELKEKFLAGIPLPDSITDDLLNFFIKSSISELENWLGIKFNYQIVEESQDYHSRDFRNFGFLKMSYPVRQPLEIWGGLNYQRTFEIPKNNISVKISPSEKQFSRIINVIMVTYQNYNLVKFRDTNLIPNFWKIKYLTGWKKGEMPFEILEAIGVLTSIKVLQIISDALMAGTAKKIVDSNGKESVSMTGVPLTFGLGLGVSSKSISIDGLSQNFSTYANGQTGIWGARLKQYLDMTSLQSPQSLYSKLSAIYHDITFGVA